MTREELTNMPYEEAAQKMEAELNSFKQEVDTIKDLDQLKQMEQDIIKDMEEYETYLKQVTYKLPDKCTFDGKTYTKNDVARFVIQFINKMEVEWPYTLGIYQLGKLWKNKDMSEMTYYEYDSTLRTLGQLRFKGLDEQESILVVNEFMKDCHETYSKDTSYQILNAQKHDSLVKRMELVSPLETSQEV